MIQTHTRQKTKLTLTACLLILRDWADDMENKVRAHARNREQHRIVRQMEYDIKEIRRRLNPVDNSTLCGAMRWPWE